MISSSGMNIERLLLRLSQKDLETTYIYDDHLIIEAWETLWYVLQTCWLLKLQGKDEVTINLDSPL